VKFHFDDDQFSGLDPAGHVLAVLRTGVPFDCVNGTLQNDILKEYIARRSSSSRRARHCADYGYDRLLHEACAEVEYDLDLGYHIREAGSTAVQELAFTLPMDSSMSIRVLRRE